MDFIVQSGNAISQETILKILLILEESECPSESLKNSIADFTSFEDQIIQLAPGDKFQQQISIIPKFMRYDNK